MKRAFYLVGVLLIITGVSCNKDENNPQEVLLRSKKWYASKEESTPLVTYKYLYDASDRLVRINQYQKESGSAFAYETFQYNNNGNLELSLSYYYANDLSGWILSDSTSFEYKNELLLFSHTYYPEPNSYTVSFQYEYEGSTVIKKNRFDNDELLYSILYDYSNGFCSKETRYTGSGLKTVSDYKIHHYKDGVRIRSDVYNSQDQVIQVITYEYDVSGNLVLEVSEQTDYTVQANLEYTFRYEYF